MNCLALNYGDEPPSLAESYSHLWEITQSAGAEKHLTKAEQERILRFSDPAEREHQASAMGGLRKIVSLYRKCDPGEIVFQRGEQGKPFVEDGPHFNLSHTCRRSFVVVSPVEVGLDVEGDSRRVMADDIAAKFFTGEERDYLQTLEPEVRREAFLRLWVCKESMVKLSGEGIYHGLRDARIVLDDGAFAWGDYRGRRAHLWQFAPAPGFLAAVTAWEKMEVKCFFQL